MAYLIPKETIHFWTGKFRDRDPDELPDYFVLSACGQDQPRFEPLSDWLNRQVAHRNRHVIHHQSPETGLESG